MERRLFVWFAFLSCIVIALTSCGPGRPELRPISSDSSTDSGPSEDVGECVAPTDAASLDAARIDAHDDRAPDFRLVLVDPPPSILRGETSPLRVHIERVGGFDAPVLIDLWGLPDTVWAQARESRVGDDVVELTLEASEDGEPVEERPFAVQASALGIRRVERTTISVR